MELFHLFFLYLIFLVLVIFALSFLRNNIFVWWRIFLIITIVFIYLNKITNRIISLLNYFIIQESLGLIFLLFNYSFIQFFVIIIKIGVAPLHFWVFRVTNGILGYGLVWFLTFQKLPFLLIILEVFWFFGFFLLIFGILFCYFQIIFYKGYKNIIILSSTESFSWIILGLLLSFFNSFFLFIYYILLILYLIGKFNKLNLSWVSWETILVFINLPFGVTFFVKIFSLSEIIKLGYIIILILLFIIFLSSLTFSYWLINISIKNIKFNINSSKSFFVYLYSLIILLIIYFSSKIYYIILIR